MRCWPAAVRVAERHRTICGDEPRALGRRFEQQPAPRHELSSTASNCRLGYGTRSRALSAATSLNCSLLPRGVKMSDEGIGPFPQNDIGCLHVRDRVSLLREGLLVSLGIHHSRKKCMR
jgi:hypothetical protein